MKLSINNEIDPVLWNEYVGDNVFHRFEWYSVIKDSYGLEPFFILATDEKGSFALVPSFKCGKRYISMPFTYLSGFLSNSDELLKELSDYLSQRQIFIEYREAKAFNPEITTVTSVVALSDYDAGKYLQSLSSRMRIRVRKSFKHGFLLLLDQDISNFYEIYARKMHELGTPPHSKIFFKSILNHFRKEACIHTVYDGMTPVGSMFTIQGNDVFEKSSKTVYILWVATLKKFAPTHANYYLYWHVINYYAMQGVAFIDLGTSLLGSTQLDFKHQWNPVNYSIQTVSQTQKTLYKENRLMQFLSSQWKKLPYRATVIFGPQIRKYLP